MSMDEDIREILDQANTCFAGCLDLLRRAVKIAESTRLEERDASARAAVAKAKRALSRHRKAKSR